jgi:predicted nucleic acid-binding protein
MGSTGSKSRSPRAVLDTNLILSALVFSAATLVVLRRRWQSQRFIPLVSKATAPELVRVLGYPKFRLSAEEREELLSDYLPLCESVSAPSVAPPNPEIAATHSTCRSSN